MRSRLIYFLLLFSALIINFPQVAKSPPVAHLRSAAQMVAYPLQWSASSLFDKSKNLAEFIARMKSYEKECQLLKEKLSRAEAQLILLDSAKNEISVLRRAIGFRERNPYEFNVLPAEVIGSSLDQSLIMVNRGSYDGIREGQTVINETGLVGKIIEVSKYFSKVSLITDLNAVISAALPRTGTFGVVRGGSRLMMDFVSEGASVEVGEKVVVSSASSTFLRGLPIGFVSSQKSRVEDLFQEIEIKPAVDFSKLDIVYICQP